MKLIVCGFEALSGYVSREFYYIISDLINNYDWKKIEIGKLWNRGGTIRSKLLDECGQLPETILFWEGYPLLTRYAADISRLNCRKFVMTDDLHCHNRPTRREKLVAFAVCDGVLTPYAYSWQRYFPEFSLRRVVWIPHSASPDFMFAYNPYPENAILLSGAVNQYYPLRTELEKLHFRDPRSVVYHRHPGYRHHYYYTEKGDVGHGYAAKINRHRAAFTDTSIYGNIVAKYFEIPATGALLFADDSVSRPLAELGFIENQHYLPVNKKNLEERIRYILQENNHCELDEIRKRGQRLIWERHKTSDRAQQIDAACR